MSEIIDIIDKLPHNGEYAQRKLDAIKGIIVHHSGSLQSKGYTSYDFAKWHIDPNGRLKAPRIAYHYGIEPDGTIYQCNKLESVSWHAGHYPTNKETIAIELNGNFELEQPTNEQIVSFWWLIAYLDEQFDNLYLKGHKEIVNTACPGKNLFSVFHSS